MQTAAFAQTLNYPTLDEAVLSRSQFTGQAKASIRFFAEGETASDTALAAQRKIAELEAEIARLHVQAKTDLEQARSEAENAGRQKASQEQAPLFSQLRGEIATAITAFEAGQQSYFRRVEKETVKLALAIARKILHREAQMDPLLLAGTVRAALDRLVDATGIVLRVPAAQHALWEAELGPATMRHKLSIVGDNALASGECALESRMGTIDMGVGTQLEEIERGFFDLLHRTIEDGACERCAR